MSIYHFNSSVKETLADTATPVSLYLKIRDHFPESVLLESADSSSANGRFSFIAFHPLAGVILENEVLRLSYPDGKTGRVALRHNGDLARNLNAFLKMFSLAPNPVLKAPTFGLFGYFSYDAVPYFETVSFRHKDGQIPQVRLSFYKYVLVFNHLKNTLQIVEHIPEGQQAHGTEAIERIIRHQSVPAYPFALQGPEIPDMADGDYLKMVAAAKKHCQLGNVFQMVLSRRFQQRFAGDEFVLYRYLRSLNPSPYMFYCDFGGFRLLGSSPEVQLKIENGKASVHPIAGTCRRTGEDTVDIQSAEKLRRDPKETAEHTMLVDLARNDLSRDFDKVTVNVDKALAFCSHVIHIVSEVEGRSFSHAGTAPFGIIGHNFPAGTLSGAPKYRAMQLIDSLEASARGFYGGCIGFVGFDNSVNLAIMIRSFMSAGQVLTYRAGAGIVAASVPENELQEVNNKLAALRAALAKAGGAPKEAFTLNAVK